MKTRIISLIALLGLVVGINACCITKHIPVETTTVVNYKDSTVITYKDSTIVVEIPKEVYHDYTNLLDTLKLETSVAKASAYVDTTHMILAGEIENKEDAVLPARGP